MRRPFERPASQAVTARSLDPGFRLRRPRDDSPLRCMMSMGTVRARPGMTPESRMARSRRTPSLDVFPDAPLSHDVLPDGPRGVPVFAVIPDGAFLLSTSSRAVRAVFLCCHPGRPAGPGRDPDGHPASATGSPVRAARGRGRQQQAQRLPAAAFLFSLSSRTAHSFSRRLPGRASFS